MCRFDKLTLSPLIIIITVVIIHLGEGLGKKGSWKTDRKEEEWVTFALFLGRCECLHLVFISIQYDSHQICDLGSLNIFESGFYLTKFRVSCEVENFSTL